MGKKPYAAAVAVAIFTFNQSAPPQMDCTRKTQGTFWPLEVNHDPRLLQTQAAAGDLWLCRGDYDWDAYFIQTTHFFKWERVTVRVTRPKPTQAKLSPPTE
jgi:hypothetical protein